MNNDNPNKVSPFLVAFAVEALDRAHLGAFFKVGGEYAARVNPRTFTLHETPWGRAWSTR